MIDEHGECVFDPDSFLAEDRFTVLEISELTDCNRIYSTSDNGYRLNPETMERVIPPSPFGIIFPDIKLGKNYYTGTPYNANKIYKHASLGNIDKMSVKLYNSYGNLLKYDHQYTWYQIECAFKNNDPIPLTDIRHPYNKKIQIHMVFIIGVIESNINTDTKFD
jgi:hypothetical protein